VLAEVGEERTLLAEGRTVGKDVEAEVATLELPLPR